MVYLVSHSRSDTGSWLCESKIQTKSDVDYHHIFSKTTYSLNIQADKSFFTQKHIKEKSEQKCILCRAVYMVKVNSLTCIAYLFLVGFCLPLP